MKKRYLKILLLLPILSSCSLQPTDINNYIAYSKQEAPLQIKQNNTQISELQNQIKIIKEANSINQKIQKGIPYTKKTKETSIKKINKKKKTNKKKAQPSKPINAKSKKITTAIAKMQAEMNNYNISLTSNNVRTPTDAQLLKLKQELVVLRREAALGKNITLKLKEELADLERQLNKRMKSN